MVHRVLLVAIACTTLVAAQRGGGGKNAVETKHLTVTPSVSKAGGRLTLVVDVAPKPKMHVYAPEQKDFIAISLALTAVDGVTPGKAVYPKGEKLFFPELKETQFVYSKPFRITQPIALKSTGPVTINATVRYQACDDSICYLPQSVPVSWTIP